MDPAEFHHGLTSVSDKEASADGWSRCTDGTTMPPDLLKPFDVTLLEPQDKILDGNASCGLHALRRPRFADNDARV